MVYVHDFSFCQDHLNNEEFEHGDDWLKSDLPGEMGGDEKIWGEKLK